MTTVAVYIYRLEFFKGCAQQPPPNGKHTTPARLDFSRPLIIPQPMVVGTFYHLAIYVQWCVPSSKRYYWTDGINSLSLVL